MIASRLLYGLTGLSVCSLSDSLLCIQGKRRISGGAPSAYPRAMYPGADGWLCGGLIVPCAPYAAILVSWLCLVSIERYQYPLVPIAIQLDATAVPFFV